MVASLDPRNVGLESRGMSLHGLWRSFQRSDWFFWRRLRELRALNRALGRSNRELLANQQAWVREREQQFAEDYWYRRWRALQDRPAYVVQNIELAKARTEIVRLRAQLAVPRVHQAAMPTPLVEDGAGVGGPPSSGEKSGYLDWVALRRSRRPRSE